MDTTRLEGPQFVGRVDPRAAVRRSTDISAKAIRAIAELDGGLFGVTDAYLRAAGILKNPLPKSQADTEASSDGRSRPGPRQHRRWDLSRHPGRGRRRHVPSRQQGAREAHERDSPGGAVNILGRLRAMLRRGPRISS